MKCRKYHNLISEYVDNNLSESLAAEVLEHIAECSSCKTFYLNEMKLKSFIKSSYENEVKIDITSSVMSKICPKETKKSKKVYFMFAASFVLAFLGISSFFVYNNMPINNVAKNKSNVQVQQDSEEKLQELVLEHLDRSNLIDISGIAVSNVVYEK